MLKKPSFSKSSVAVAQLVRAPGCGPGGCGFKSRRSPHSSTENGSEPSHKSIRFCDHSKSSTALTWEDAERSFFLRCRALNLAESTKALYAIRLKLWRKWAESKGLLPDSVTVDDVTDFLDFMRQAGRKGNTVDSAFRVLQTMFSHLGCSVIMNMKRPKTEKRIIKPFSLEQLRGLLAQINTRTGLGVRDHALIVLLADTGLRISEALSLNVQDVDLEGTTLCIMGKGRKERRVPFGRTTQGALIEWLKVWKAKGKDPLWCNRYGTRLHRRSFLTRLKIYGKRAGIDGIRVSPHTIRHFFAITYLRNGGDCFSLQKILGHSTLDMTRRYSELADTDTWDKHRTASPLDNMGQVPGAKRRVVI